MLPSRGMQPIRGTPSALLEGNVLARSISLALVLFGLWLLMSGYFVALLISLGIASCILVVLIARRMELVDHEGHPIQLGVRGVIYWAWLFWEIVKSNIEVARMILDPRLPISPTLFKTPATQPSELGRVIFANSITLTPGTVSVDVEGDRILVHALSQATADSLASGEMDRRVTRLEARAGS